MDKIHVPVERFPLLAAFLADGQVRRDGFGFVARSSDGVDVSIGTVDDLESAETWLQSHPSPDRW